MFADLDLARRIETAEGLSNAAFVEARARAFPESGACWTRIAGTWCMFDFVGSPVTQTFGLGMFEPVTGEGLATMERFFQDRGAGVFHEVSPLADASALELLYQRGYRPIEYTSILVRPLAATPEPQTACVVRQAGNEERALWSDLSSQGWGASPELLEFFSQMAAVNAELDQPCFFAEIDGSPVATGALNLRDGIALLAGASTLPEFRCRGAQQSLLAYRLYFAASQGCTMAMMGALPGSTSQKNAQRNGFAMAYTRLKWQLA